MAKSKRPRGFIVCSQWHSRGAKHIDDILQPARHTGDAAAVDQICGFTPPAIQPVRPSIYTGEVCFQVEHDGKLTLIETRYDTSG